MASPRVVECTTCKHQQERFVFYFYIFMLLLLSMGLITSVGYVRKRYGWYVLILLLPLLLSGVFLVLLVGLLWLVLYVAANVLTYLWYCWRKCPSCGGRRWSWPLVNFQM